MAALDFKQALDEHLGRVDLPPEVVRLETQLSEDSAGDQAVYVTVVLRDGLAPSQRSFLYLQPLGSKLRDAVYGFQGGPSFMAATPYIRFVTEAELDDPEA